MFDVDSSGREEVDVLVFLGASASLPRRLRKDEIVSQNLAKRLLTPAFSFIGNGGEGERQRLSRMRMISGLFFAQAPGDQFELSISSMPG